MKIALVHDFLIQDGGAERVLRAFCNIWPDAPIFTIVHSKKNSPEPFKFKKINSSFLQKIPFGVRNYQWFLPIMPAAVERLDLSDFDVVLSSASAFSKGIITHPQTLHICYCHTPTRYLWSDTLKYIDELNYNSIIKKTVPLILPRLRVWDKLSADRVDLFIANSKTVSKRIKKYYGRESDIINPPVETDKFGISEKPGEYFLTGGRLVPYKRFDIAIKVFSRLGIPLKIFGTGPELKNLRNISRKNIEFLGQISDEEKTEVFKNAIAFINPQEEDFGITALESMASGRPVIALAKGGARETIIAGVTGEFFEEQTWESLAHAVLKFKSDTYSPARIREYALQFDTEIFKEKIKSFVENSKHKYCEI